MKQAFSPVVVKDKSTGKSYNLWKANNTEVYAVFISDYVELTAMFHKLESLNSKRSGFQPQKPIKGLGGLLLSYQIVSNDSEMFEPDYPLASRDELKSKDWFFILHDGEKLNCVQIDVNIDQYDYYFTTFDLMEVDTVNWFAISHIDFESDDYGFCTESGDYGFCWVYEETWFLFASAQDAIDFLKENGA